METQQAYDKWSAIYDSNFNPTRDLEGLVLRSTLADLQFDSCLEIGCGTGKNTEWLITRASHVTAVDLSSEMLAKARAKVISPKVDFRQADITSEWKFCPTSVELVSFSLVLEHIQDLPHIFREVSLALAAGGHAYIGELHPFKQYAGSKARFETAAGTQELICFNHHISDYIDSAKAHGLHLQHLGEHFDTPDRSGIPRILSLLFKKA